MTWVDLLHLVHRTCGIACEPDTRRTFLYVDNGTIAPYGQRSVHDDESINARQRRDESNAARYFVPRVVFFSAEDSLVEMQDDGHQFLTRLKEAFMDFIFGVAQLDRVNGKALQCLTQTVVRDRVLDAEPGVAIVMRQQDRAAMSIALNSEESPGERLSPVARNATGPVTACLKDLATNFCLNARNQVTNLGMKDRLNRPRLAKDIAGSERETTLPECSEQRIISVHFDNADA